MIENGIRHIAVYGDSILKGAITGTGSGNLFDITENDSLLLASRALDFELTNRSVFGSTAVKTCRRLMRDLNNGINAELVIIESGGNDCDYDWAPVSATPDAPHAMRTDIGVFLRTMSEMAAECRKRRITPLVMTLPPLITERWFRHISRELNQAHILRFLGGDYATLYRNHARYNMRLEELCRREQIQTVDMRQAMLDAPDLPSLMCSDGIHPNEAGYRSMADVWIRELPKVRREF